VKKSLRPVYRRPNKWCTKHGWYARAQDKVWSY